MQEFVEQILVKKLECEVKMKNLINESYLFKIIGQKIFILFNLFYHSLFCIKQSNKVKKL